MGTQYDEDLTENDFFKQLKSNFEDVLKTVSENHWIVCVPRKGCFVELELSKSDVLEHILIRNSEDYSNLNGKKIRKLGDDLIYESKDSEKFVRVLFREDFVIKSLKYSIWCIDEFLFSSSLNSVEIIQINTFSDCVNFLWTDTLGCFVLDEINSLVQKFLLQNTFDELNLKGLQNAIEDLYKSCLDVALIHFDHNFEENFYNNLKLSVESFMQACLKDKLFNFICTHTAVGDANVNKIIRNSQDISLKNLEIERYFEIIPIARLELNKINNGNIILSKIVCLKTVFNILKGVDTENLLKILIFLILKSNVCNWIANVVFVSNFYFSKKSNDFCTENNYIITTLNAALKYISENHLNPLRNPTDDTFNSNSFSDITKFIREGNLTLLMRNLCYQNKLTEKLCHPLCSCDECEKLLRNNRCEIDSRDEKGGTFLHHAAKSDHPDIVHFLIVEGSDINAIDYSGLTPLHYAVSAGNQHATFLLLHAGCEANCKDFEGNSSLHVAVKNGHENCVEALLFFTNNLGENVDVNCINNNGDTPLHLASKYGYLNLVKLLIDFGAKFVTNKRGLTPLSIAHNDFIKDILINIVVISDYVVIKTDEINSKLNSNEEISSISKTDRKIKFNFEKNANFGQSPKDLNQIKKTDLLLKAIESNDTPLTCFYLGIPMPNFSNETPSDCHPLCTCKKCSATKEETPSKQTNSQINRKNVLNVNVCNPEGLTPLHVASKFGRIEILRVLLDAGASINLKTYKNFYTPLHLACINRRKVVVRELLKCGNCSVDVVDVCGNTPLFYAVLNDDFDTFEMLLNDGADVRVKNRDGNSVRDIAEDRNFGNVLKVLKERDKRYDVVDFVS